MAIQLAKEAFGLIFAHSGRGQHQASALTRIWNIADRSISLLKFALEPQILDSLLNRPQSHQFAENLDDPRLAPQEAQELSRAILKQADTITRL